MSETNHSTDECQALARQVAVLQRELAELRASAAKLTREQFRTVIRYAQADLNKAVENYLHTLGIEVSDE